MKKIYISLMAVALLAGLSSCQKKFDTKSYAPTKPLPTYGGFNSSNEIESANLIDYWNFSGTLTDSVSKLPGIATGSTFGTGVSGQGFVNALNQYAVCQSSPAIAAIQSFTVSAWINTPPPTTGVLDYFSLSNTTQFWGNIEIFFDNGSTNTDAHFRAHLSQSGGDNTFAAEVPGCFDKWVNLIFSYDVSGACVLYVNGAAIPLPAGAKMVTAGSLKGPLAFTNVGNVVFGCPQFMTNPSQTSGTTSQPWASYLVGSIDQVRVYNTVLTPTEALALYNLEKIGR
jgi:hypothetical protein